jgi:TonB-linked SusC/RagA family outer membrane protein
MRKFALLLTCLLLIGIHVVFAQSRTLTGKVTDSDDGSSLPGVSVVVKGTSIGTVTDIDGKFSLNVTGDSKILRFSFIGYDAQEVDISKVSTVTLALEKTTLSVDEVVVTAMGIKKDKKALGYAVQGVKEEEIVRTRNSDLAGAMQGKVAGVEIKPSSGMPGASSQIVIRGARSFTDNNTPLYVVDGMPIASTADFSTGQSTSGADISNRAADIDPSDIESIDILKGQSAAALYGIRASNGVVIITTKSGRKNEIGKPVISITHNSNFSVVSRTPDYQDTYAQGSYGSYVPTASTSWGPKISELPNDPKYGGNLQGQAGKYYVPQLDKGKQDPWVTPQIFNNWDDYFQTGYSTTNGVNVSQANKSGNFALGVNQTKQTGIALNTGMDRWNAKAIADQKLSENFKVGFSANYSRNNIDKLTGANDGSLQGVLAAPRSYNLKGYPCNVPGDPYSQIYFRGGNWDNPYWIPDNNTFNEKTERFFGNGFIAFNSNLNESMKLNIRYQVGTDSYTTHYQDIFGYGSKGKAGTIDNYGVTSSTINSLATANFDWTIVKDIEFSAMIGNEFNNTNTKKYDQFGTDFNFGGWNHIDNVKTVTASESQYSDRTVGFFGSLSLSWKSMLFLNATGRNDVVSTMPRNNRSFFYPSVSLGFVLSEIEAVKELSWISFAKLRGSYAEVGQAGNYYQNYFVKPDYSGGFWSDYPIQYPLGNINSYIPSYTQYDPKLKPQNTKSYEFGGEFKFFNNRLGIDYTFSKQIVTDQIFAVPLAASTGAGSLVMNGGQVHTDAHEIMFYVTPIKTKNFQWDVNLNYTKIVNVVDSLASGVESIYLGGFTTPQVRAGIGATYPVIYGVGYARDAAGNILVEDNPGDTYHGMPMAGEPKVIGNVSPDFILNGTTSFTYKSISLSAVVEWKQGGQMYSGSNGLLDLYGMSARTNDRESTFVFKGVKPDGTPNDIVRGGPNDPDAVQDLYADVLGNIDEFYIYDNSFVKLREVALKYDLPKMFSKKLKIGVSIYARNILLWTALPNMDPESSQGNNNMGGSFERFSMPQATSYGFGFDVTF